MHENTKTKNVRNYTSPNTSRIGLKTLLCVGARVYSSLPYEKMDLFVYRKIGLILREQCGHEKFVEGENMSSI